MARHFIRFICLLTFALAVHSAALSGDKDKSGGDIACKCRAVLAASLLTHFNEGCECGNGSTYYKSINNAYLNGARDDCVNRLGGRLLAIETKEELTAVKQWLIGQGDSAGNFWTAGSYSDDVGKFVWPSEDGENNVAFGDFINWAPGQPDIPAVGADLYGVELLFRGATNAMQFKVIAGTDNSRYICEIKK